MTEPQKMQLIKNRQDAIMDITGLLIVTTMMVFVMRPDLYDRVTEAVNTRLNALSHRVSVWQTRLSIRSLPQTNDS